MEDYTNKRLEGFTKTLIAHIEKSYKTDDQDTESLKPFATYFYTSTIVALLQYYDMRQVVSDRMISDRKTTGLHLRLIFSVGKTSMV